MAWGPYLWADGATQRFDGLSWNCADFQSTGIDPAASGRNTVARMLLDFLHTDTTARPWYLSQPLPTPTPAVAVVVNSAGYGKTVATGSIATIFGSNLSGGSAAAAVFPLPHELLGTRVEIDGTPALLYYVSPTQINFVVPAEGGSTLSVVRGSTAGAKVGPGIAFWAPGLFTLDSTPGGPAAAEHSDGTVISAANPARRGETIQIFGTGVGYVNPLLAIPVPVPVVQFGGQAGRVTYAGPAPGIPGVTQINVIVPLAAPTGNAVELSFQLGIAGSNAAVIAIGAN
jgi:uncharacterized protein (TIGR03437 family)